MTASGSGPLGDDEREHAQVMCEALTRRGYKCDVTYNLAEAMGRLERKAYDVVVTDLVMDNQTPNTLYVYRVRASNAGVFTDFTHTGVGARAAYLREQGW